MTWRSVIGLIARRDYWVDPHGLRGWLDEHLPYREVGRATVPLHAVAIDVLGGAVVQLSAGSVAVLASCAISAAFPPVRIGALIDGAVACNTPISVAVELGARRLLGDNSAARGDRPRYMRSPC